MKSKQTNGDKSPHIDDNYQLSMPLQQKEPSSIESNSRRTLNFDKSQMEASVNAGKIIRNNDDNEIYSMYQNQVKQLRQSKNDNFMTQNSSGSCNNSEGINSSQSNGLPKNRSNSASNFNDKFRQNRGNNANYLDKIDEENSQ